MDDSNPDLILDTSLPLMIYVRPEGEPPVEWREFDQGPGHIVLPAGYEISLRVKKINDDDLYTLVKATAGLSRLTTLNLSENRKITDVGLTRLTGLPGIRHLNLSSCSITNQGLASLAALKKLEHLNVSYCNRITDEGLRALKALPRLQYLDIQGCVKTSHAGVRRIERRGLTIHR